jgi:hypothetical protein
MCLTVLQWLCSVIDLVVSWTAAMGSVRNEYYRAVARQGRAPVLFIDVGRRVR